MPELQDVNLEIGQLGHEATLAKRFLDSFVEETRKSFLSELVKSKVEEKEYRENLYLLLRFLDTFNNYLLQYISGAQGNVLINQVENILREE